MNRSTVSRCLAAAVLCVPLWAAAQDVGGPPQGPTGPTPGTDVPSLNVPEPETLWLVGLAIVGAVASRRKRRK